MQVILGPQNLTSTYLSSLPLGSSDLMLQAISLNTPCDSYLSALYMLTLYLKALPYHLYPLYLILLNPIQMSPPLGNSQHLKVDKIPVYTVPAVPVLCHSYNHSFRKAFLFT